MYNIKSSDDETKVSSYYRHPIDRKTNNPTHFEYQTMNKTTTSNSIAAIKRRVAARNDTRINQRRPWRVEDEQLKNVPYFYKLDLSYVIVDKISAPVICGRICEFSRINSLVARWDKNEPTSIICSTQDDVALQINLWAAGESGKIIVEARRWKGDAFKFHQLRRLIYRMLGGVGNGKFQDAKRKALASPKTITFPLMPSKSNPDTEEQKYDLLSDAMTSIAIAGRCMQKQCTEEKVAGIKILEHLTNPQHMNTYITTCVSVAIWTGYDALNKRKVEVTNMLLKNAFRFSNEPLNDPVHRWSVRVIGNVLFHMTSKVLKQYTSISDMCRWAQTIPSILNDMKTYEQDAHMACIAVRCLRAFVKAKVAFDGTCTGLFQHKEIETIQEIIVPLIKFGTEEHKQLEDESMKLFTFIQNQAK